MSKQILVIRFGSLGDVILTSATVMNLRLAYPASRILFLTKERFRPLVETFGTVDEIVTLGDNSSAIEYARLLLELDRRNFDIIVDLHGNVRSWLARKTLTATSKVFYPKRRAERAAAVREKLRPIRPTHTIDAYNDTLRQLGSVAVCTRPVISPPELTKEELAKLGIDNSIPSVAIAPGAAHKTKQWPMEKFAEVAKRLHDSKVRIVWLVTGEDSGKSNLETALGKDAFVELTDWPVDRLAAVIARVDLILSNDSGMAHLGSAVGTPVMAVFGPTHPALGFAPRGLFDLIIEVDEKCRPCSLHGAKDCYRDARYCFDRITSESVFKAAERTIRRTREFSPAVFLDRDGTVIVDKDYLSDPEQVELEVGAVEGMKRIVSMGYKIVIVSNQSGVGRGLFDTDSVEQVNGKLQDLLLQNGIEVDAMYYCPHYKSGPVAKYAVDCLCRKPGAGMAEAAATQIGIDLRKSFVVGDKISDLNLARNIGATGCLVRTGFGIEEERILNRSSDGSLFSAYDDLRAVADIIERSTGR